MYIPNRVPRIPIKNLDTDNSSYKEELNFFDNLIKMVWSKPAGKAVIITGGVAAVILVSGVFFRLMAWLKEGYLQFKNAGNGSGNKQEG